MVGGAIFSKFKILFSGWDISPVHNYERTEVANQVVSFGMYDCYPALNTKHFLCAMFQLHTGVTKLQSFNCILLCGSQGMVGTYTLRHHGRENQMTLPSLLVHVFLAPLLVVANACHFGITCMGQISIPLVFM